MEIRRYKFGEEEAVWQVYYRSTREVISREYTPEQVKRWAPDIIDQKEWTQRLIKKNPFVAVANDKIVGFAELEPDGHIDRFYCLPEWVGKGVGTQLLNSIEREAFATGIERLFAESSTLAIGFFKSKGFEVVEERINTVCEAPARQYLIEKNLVDQGSK